MTAENIALVCPLDWGIGHATRCVPVVKALQEQGFRVIVAADGRPYEFFRNEYPDTELRRFPGTPVRYPARDTYHVTRDTWHVSRNTCHVPRVTTLSMTLTMLATLPRLFLGFQREHKYLGKLVEQTGARLVISDNRYGCWHPSVKSVFITHQLNMQVPRWMRWVRPILRKFIYSSVSKYDECWVPDGKDEGGLSGRLSHCSRLPGNCHYIGTLSRFSDFLPEPAGLPCPPTEIFVMLSGPEPQRSILENLIIGQLRATSYAAIIAGGRTESHQQEVIEGRIHIFPHLSSNSMKHYITEAKYVICRSGYSTLMDLAALGKSAILIPTPGQTEQEYLAKRLMKMNIHHSVTQAEFQLDEAIRDFTGYNAIRLQNDLSLMKQRIKRLTSQVKISGSGKPGKRRGR